MEAEAAALSLFARTTAEKLPDDPTPITPEAAKETWNQFADRLGLAAVRVLTEKRKRAVARRLKEEGFDLPAILTEIERSPGLQGKNDRGWRVTFDFVFCSANNYAKILEGNYRRWGNSSNGIRPTEGKYAGVSL